MTNIPDFIGIGVQKGGTSWLHRQFVAHPQIFIPPKRKEIHFFDHYFDKGATWYKKWFEDKNGKQTAQQSINKCSGEITPNYIYDEAVAPRLHAFHPDVKLIIMLRHPVRRAYSHYQMLFQSGQGQQYSDFDDFMHNHPHGFKRGLYGAQITRWLEYFNKEQFLFLISEEVFENPDAAFDQIAGFLNIDATLFDRATAQKPVGRARHAPANSTLAVMAQKTRLFLRDHDLDFIATWLKKIGLTRQIFGTNKNNKIPPLTPESFKKWEEAYVSDIKLLEKQTGRSFSLWRSC